MEEMDMSEELLFTESETHLIFVKANELLQKNCCGPTVHAFQQNDAHRSHEVLRAEPKILSYLYVAQMCKYDTITRSVLHDIIPL